MSKSDSDTMFSDCTVKFGLGQGEHFLIKPDLYLNFDDEETLSSKLLRVNFELNTKYLSRQVGDHVYLKSFVALREYLSHIQTAQVGDVLEFTSEEQVVAMTFTRQETTMRIAGRTPNDGYCEAMYTDFESKLEKRFATQIIFYCNFPLKKIPAVVDEMTRVLQVIENLG